MGTEPEPVLEQFGPYRLERLLGRGGMGEVFRAFDTEYERLVAVKRLNTHLADDVEFQQRFRREARLAAQLRNPHIIPIHRYGELDGHLYIDMRYVDGFDVGDLINTVGPLGPARAVTLIEQAASALATAHGAGLVHRDVKPSNLLIDREAADLADGFLYLADFGISRSTSSTRSNSLTRTGALLGSLDYMAPEQFEGVADPQVDVYSLTCVLFELLTGNKPYRSGNLPMMMHAHLNIPPPAVSETRPELPRAFDEVIRRGMAKRTDERFASALELARAARSALRAGATTSNVDVRDEIEQDEDARSQETALILQRREEQQEDLEPRHERGEDADVAEPATSTGRMPTAEVELTAGSASEEPSDPASGSPEAATSASGLEDHTDELPPDRSEDPTVEHVERDEVWTADHTEGPTAQPDGEPTVESDVEPTVQSDVAQVRAPGAGDGVDPSAESTAEHPVEAAAQRGKRPIVDPLSSLDEDDADVGTNDETRVEEGSQDDSTGDFPVPRARADKMVAPDVTAPVVAPLPAPADDEPDGPSVVQAESSDTETEAPRDRHRARITVAIISTIGIVLASFVVVGLLRSQSDELPPSGTTVAPTAPALPPLRASGTPSVGSAVLLSQDGQAAEPQGAALSPSGETLYITDASAKQLIVFDINDNAVQRRISLPGVPNPRYVALSSDGQRAFVSRFVSPSDPKGDVVAVNLSTGAIETSGLVGTFPYALATAPDGRVWVPDHNNTASIAVLDPNTLVEVDEVIVTENPHAVTFSPDGELAYSANHESGQISIIDTATGDVKNNVSVNARPHSIAVSPDGDSVATANYSDRSVSVLTVEDGSVKVFGIGVGSQSIMWSADGRFLYLPAETSGELITVDPSTGDVASTVPIGTSPRFILGAVNGSQLYVTNHDSGTISVVRASE